MKKIITISREFGSGGRTIGKKVAEQLGYAYYDKELIEKAAKDSGLSQEYIEEHGEGKAGRSFFNYAFMGRDFSGASMGDYLWNIQCKAVEDIAEDGNCVIVGRCADYILKGRDDAFHIFVHADVEFRKERIVKLYGETQDSPEKRLIAKDKARAMNYKYYTDQVWGMAKNYHLALDSSEIGIDTCVEIIVNGAKNL